MEYIWIIVGVVVGALVGGFASYFAARARAKAIVAKAEADGEMIKKTSRGVGPRWYTESRPCGGFYVRHIPGL